jgi:hypothetical protein
VFSGFPPFHPPIHQPTTTSQTCLPLPTPDVRRSDAPPPGVMWLPRRVAGNTKHESGRLGSRQLPNYTLFPLAASWSTSLTRKPPPFNVFCYLLRSTLFCFLVTLSTFMSAAMLSSMSPPVAMFSTQTFGSEISISRHLRERYADRSLLLQIRQRNDHHRVCSQLWTLIVSCLSLSRCIYPPFYWPSDRFNRC